MCVPRERWRFGRSTDTPQRRRRKRSRRSPGPTTTAVQGKKHLSYQLSLYKNTICRRYICVFNLLSLAVITPAITPTGRRTPGSTLSRPRRAWRWRRRAAAQRKTARRRGTGRKRGRRTRWTKTERYQRRSSQRRRGRSVVRKKLLPISLLKKWVFRWYYVL